ncbi:MAG: hypothetical protein HFF49_01250 [Lawsonibacter sp.]|jgi:hypothetical protein|nr:hypothetical protein [Lawsonibacter sp.]
MAYTHLKPGEHLEISETSYFHPKESAVAALVALSPQELEKMEQASIEQEQAIYDSICSIAHQWVDQALHTTDIRKAREYLRTPATSHTSNQWVKEKYDWYERSNMVYKMTYRIYEGTDYRSNIKPRPIYWELSWYLTFNTPKNPDYSGNGWQIAGQHQKRFTDKAEMERYLQGRIKAYSHLFVEISPPIPEEQKKRFFVNGVLLPGYTVDTPERYVPDEGTVDDLLACLGEDFSIDGLGLPPEPQEKTPEAVWSERRKHRSGNSQRKTAPTR